VTKSSGSDRLDQAACDWIKSHWKWQPPTQLGKPVVATTGVAFTWNLKDAQ
jgi:outer membrane biosynthesis protein TonB